MDNYILIDGSYFIFHRYHALIRWSKLAISKDSDEPIDINECIFDKFISTFHLNISQISKKLKLINPTIYVGVDCKRLNIWRQKHFPQYKATRSHNEFIGRFFKYVKDNHMWSKSNAKVLHHPQLEADDCIALAVKQIKLINPMSHVTIISSDTDYLQLDDVDIFNLSFKSIRNDISPRLSLFIKVVCGDKSDNISGIFKRCGIKTAIKFFHDKEVFDNAFLKYPEAVDLYERNTLLISFNSIPNALATDFLNTF
jgi:5'-3' exonuclease